MDRFEQFNRRWLKVLPILYIIATFEHNFATLRYFNAHMSAFGINLSVLSKVVLVLALDLSIYYSVQYTVQAPKHNVDTRAAKLILLLSGMVSVALNVHYMIHYSPGGWFATTIGAIVGALIPLMLVLFGWLTGTVRSHPDTVSTSSTQVNHDDGLQIPPARDLDQLVTELVRKHPDWSNRKIARKLKCSHTTVGRIRRKHRL